MCHHHYKNDFDHRLYLSEISDLNLREKGDQIGRENWSVYSKYTTSGLSITGLNELYPEQYQKMFMEIQFFNTSYQMTLCELTPTCYIDRKVFDEVYAYEKDILFRTMVEV